MTREELKESKLNYQQKLELNLIRPLIFLLVLNFIIVGCGDDSVPLPKPRMYPRVHFPERIYEAVELEFCSFIFEKPSYVKIEKDEQYFDDKPLNPCWFDLVYENFDARIHFSYYPIDSEKRFQELKNDAFVLSQKHNIVANYIDELPIDKSETVKGFLFDLEGEVASPVQFYLTDEKKNFLRGSLYFNTKSRPDSLAPMVDFIKMDVLKLVDSFDWK